MRRAKIVCTLGPSSDSQERIDALVAAGMDCARLNFSHGDHAAHARVAKMVREAAAKARRPLAILADLCGPKMRVGVFRNGPVQLVVGAPFTLTTRPDVGDEHGVTITYDRLPQDVTKGDAILLDDGLMTLRVVDIVGPDVRCVVEVGGTLSNKKGLNLPGVQLSTPAVTDKDKSDLAFAVNELAVEYVALSFVRRASDILEVRELAKGTPIIAKIEKPEAVDNLGEIIDASDGAMVARGDLGVEMGAEKVPLIQKRIIREVNARGKLVITATQMLDSMIRNPRPTRAEAADVANAILDGTDAVMLSGETASGAYPMESVSMMSAIIREVEDAWLRGESADPLANIVELTDWEFSGAAARSAALMSHVLPLKAIVTFTNDGRSANILSDFRPRAPILAVTADWRVANRLALEWGVTPRVEIPPEDTEEALRIACSLVAREKVCGHGDPFAMVVGWPPSGRTNTVKLHRL